MFRQYAEHKARHKDAVLFFRMGDFYEMFRSDAVEVSRLLNLTLTQRQGIPMCGIPYHAAGNYIARLLKLGKKIAICEQVELPQDGKGLAKREVVEVVTPGTVVDDTYLDERSDNYLAVLAFDGRNSAYAYIDLSTAEFRATILNPDGPKDALRREMAKTSPKEIIVQESLLESETFVFLLDEDIVINRIPDWNFDIAESENRLKRQFGTVNLKAFDLGEGDVRTLAAGAILDYLEINHNNLLPHVRSLTCYGERDSVGLDESTIRNLEIVRSLQDGGYHYTLLDTLDHTKTSAGARFLKKRLLQPFPDGRRASAYHDRVEALYRNQTMLSGLRTVLGGIQDLQRLAARTAMERAHAKDLVAIRNTLEKADEAKGLVEKELWDCDSEFLEELFETAGALSSFLEKSLLDDPSILLTEGRLIREGWDQDIDRMRSIRDEGRDFLNAYIQEEKAATGLSSLKLKHNRILGYFIEVSKNQSQTIPDRFRRRQSLTQVERFSTNRLEELESEISSVGERLVERERTVFLEIRDRVKSHAGVLLEIGRLIADLDLVQSYAHVATEKGYVRPVMSEDAVTKIRNGRHPVVEHHMPPGAFVPNSVDLDGEGISFILVTGPNMAGKSTVLRQVALISLMAQAGSFVPAEEAHIGVADRIFCRVGASDNLARGESTFLVEMNETANILRNASGRSLVIMDEVGRGTGTADGLSIAQAVSEYLLNHQSPRTLFATHYRELTKLEHKSLKNMSMAVTDTGETVVFPKQLIDGPAEASYGIHVASLAGLPGEVIRRAKNILTNRDRYTEIEEDKPKIAIPQEPLAPLLFDPKEMVIDSLLDLDLDNLTPIEALTLLSRWKNELR